MVYFNGFSGLYDRFGCAEERQKLHFMYHLDPNISGWCNIRMILWTYIGILLNRLLGYYKTMVDYVFLRMI